MMRRIVGSSLKLPYLILFAAAAMTAVGILEVRRAPADVFPEFAPPRVEVQTPALGLSAAEVEELITVPMEEQLNGVAGLDVIRSSSVPQLSAITLIFRRGTNLIRARQLVQERLALVAPQLPTYAQPPQMRQPTSSTSRVLKIGITSDTVDLIELSSIIRHTIRQRLQRVPGVAAVGVWGNRKEQHQVQMDPVLMTKHHVTTADVLDATTGALEAPLLKYRPGSVIGSGGFVDTPNQRLQVHHLSPINEPGQLGQVTFFNSRGELLRLSDVAHVEKGHPPLQGDAIVNGKPGLLLVVEKFPGANTLAVTHGVEKALDELRPGLKGIEIEKAIFRPATFIETAFHNLTVALVIGCLLVILILVSFLFEWRTALISLVSIPLSLIAALLVLAVRGASINVMLLAGLVIAIGIVVDDAIIGVENIWRRVRQAHQAGRPAKSMPGTILEASLEVRGPIFYATIINVVAVVPVFFLQGLTGAFFKPLVVSYALAVLASMVVALTVTPAMSLLLLRRGRLGSGDAWLVRHLKSLYARLLAPTILRPLPVFSAVGVIAVTGGFALPHLGQSLLPDFKERDFLIHWLTKPGTSLSEEKRVAARACTELITVPGVRNCGSHIGQAAFADEVVGVNDGEIWISIDRHADYDKTIAAVETTIAPYSGLFRDVQTYLRERVSEVLAGSSENVVVRISGPNLDVLHEQAELVNERLKGTEGLKDLHIERLEAVPQIDVEVNLKAAGRYGLKPGDVRRASAVWIQGQEVNDIWKPTRVFDVSVWSVPRARRNLNSLRNLLLDVPGGGQVRLRQVATVRVAASPNAIKREDVTRRIDVGANLSGTRDLGSVVKEVEERLAGVNLPLGYSAKLVGESAERESAQQTLLAFGLAGAVGILLLLQAAFASARLAVVFFLTLPLALAGGVLAALVTGGNISLGSLVGFFTVFGIAARNGILLINHCQHLEQVEGVPFGPALVLRGAQERITPILMTASATGLAILPLVLSGNIPGHEIEHPMAVVILGGLVTSTAINLFLVPVLYLRFAKSWARAPAEQQLAPPSALPARAS
jgi:CzcA family heavy metal efflux pump